MLVIVGQERRSAFDEGRGLVRVQWLAVAVCVVAGCSSGQASTGDPEDLGEVPLLGAGTELGDGFVVPEGAELMTWPTGADGFSSDAEPVWGASMWVTGDPIELFNDLAAQATELGFDVVEQDSGDCRILEQTPPYPWISCFTDGYRVGGGVRSERVSMSVSVRGEAVPVAQVGVVTVATERVGEFGDGPWQLRRFEPVTARADAPDVDLARSDVGVGDFLVDADWHRTTLVDGSRLVVSGAESECTAGMKAVVHVDGDPDEVFDAYADQLTARAGAFGEPAEATTRPDVLGRRIRVLIGAGDSSFATATMVVGREGEPTRILIQEKCND